MNKLSRHVSKTAFDLKRITLFTLFAVSRLAQIQTMYALEIDRPPYEGYNVFQAVL